MKCANINSPEFKSLLEETKLSSFKLSAVIGVLSDNKSDDYFPSLQEINNYIRNQNKVQFSLQQETQLRTLGLNTEQWFEENIVPVLDKMSQLFPQIKTEVVSEQDLGLLDKAIADKIRELQAQGKRVNSFYHNGKVYVIKERVNKEIAIEEFLHPFINALEQDNSQLYKSLLLEAKKLFPELKKSVFGDYKNVYKSQFELDREFLTQALSQSLKEELDGVDNGEQQRTWVQKFLDWIKSVLLKLSTESRLREFELSELSPDMKLQDLATLLSQKSTRFSNLKTDRKNFEGKEVLIQFSLTDTELKFYREQASTQAQKDVLDSIAEKTRDIEKVNHDDGHSYFLRLSNTGGVDIPMDSVTSIVNPGAFTGNKATGRFGTAIHKIADYINQNPPIGVFEGERIDEFLSSLGLDEFVKKAYYTKEEDIEIQSKEMGRQLFSEVIKYLSALKSRGSLILSETVIGERFDPITRKPIAGTTDIIEVTTEGKIRIHDFKTMSLYYKQGEEWLPLLDEKGGLTKHGKDKTKEAFIGQYRRPKYIQQQSLYAALLSQMDIHVDDMIIVPIFYQSQVLTDDQGNIIKDQMAIRRYEGYKKSAPLFQIFVDNPLSQDNVENQTYFLPIDKKYIRQVGLKYVGKPKAEDAKKVKDISDLERLRNSQRFNEIINDMFVQLTKVVSQYEYGSDEVKQEVYKIFSKDGQTDLGDIKSALNTLMESLKNGEDVKKTAVEFTQMLNYINETFLGIRNLREELQSKITTKTDLNNRDEIIKKVEVMQKINALAQSFKPVLVKMKAEAGSDIQDNPYINMIEDANAEIDAINNSYQENVVPLLARVLEMFYTPETKARVLQENLTRIEQLKEQLSRATKPSAKRHYEDLIKKYESLASLYVPNATVFESLIKGEKGDASAFASHLLALINSYDMVTSASAGILGEVIHEITVDSMRFTELLGLQLQKLEEAKGIARENVKGLMGDLTYIAPVLTRDSDGKPKKIFQKFFVREVDETVYFEYDEKHNFPLQDLYDKKHVAEKDGSPKEVIDNINKEIEAALKKKREFEAIHFAPKYKKEYEDALALLDTLVTGVDSEGNTVTINPRERFESLWARLNQLQSELPREDFLQGRFHSEEQREQVDEAWAEINNMSSYFDLEGQEKSDVEKKIADVFKKRKEALDKFRSVESNRALWKHYRDKVIGQFGEDSPELAEWDSYNTRTVLKQEYYDRKAEIQAEISSILDKYKTDSEIADLEKQNQAIWQQIFILVKPYRGKDKYINSDAIPETIRKEVKEYEEMLEANKASIQELMETVSPEDKQSLAKLYADFYKFETRTNTQQYLEDLQKARVEVAAELGLTIGDITPELLNEHSQWHRDNHVESETVTKDGIRKTVYNPVYYYRHSSPSTEEYMDIQPAIQYSRINYEKALNPDRLDKFGRPNVKKSSPYYRPAHFKKINEGTMNKVGEVAQALVGFMEQTQEGLHQNNQIGYAVPAMPKELWEIARTGDYQSFMDFLKRKVVRTEQDIDEGIEVTREEQSSRDATSLTDLTGAKVKFLPVRFTSRLEAENQSDNVFQALGMYQMSATKAKKLESKKSFFEVLEATLEMNTPAEVTGDGRTRVDAIQSSLKKRFNIDIAQFVPGKTNVRVENIQELINRVFYDQFKQDAFKVELFGRTITDTKVADTVLGYAGSKIMFMNIPNWVVNAISGNIQSWIEAAGSKYFGKSERLWAEKNVYKYAVEMMKDRGKIADRSYHAQMADYFNYMQGEYINEFGEKTSWNSWLKSGQQLFFSGKIYGEWEMQTKTFLAMMKAKKVTQIVRNSDGSEKEKKVISLWEAYEKGADGVPKLKPDIYVSTKEEVNGVLQDKLRLFTSQDETEYRNRIQAINKSLNGAYAKIDQLKGEKYSLVRALTFMRKYFVPLFANRFANRRFDTEFADWREGYYRTTFSLLQDWWYLGDSVMKRYKEGKLTEEQMYNLRRTIADFSVFIGFSVLIALLASLREDDDENEWLMRLQYVMLKARREHVTTLPVPGLGFNEFYSVFKSPYIMMSQIGHAYKFSEAMLKLPVYHLSGEARLFEEDLLYQRKTGIWKKGDSKTLNYFMKTFGIKHEWLTAPESLEKAYEYQVAI